MSVHNVKPAARGNQKRRPYLLKLESATMCVLGIKEFSERTIMLLAAEPPL